MGTDYETFIASKGAMEMPTGIADPPALNQALFPHQSTLVRWALRRGRAAVFCDTGLGKMFIEVEWARVVAAITGRPVLILAPLAVAAQIAAEGKRFGIPVAACRDQAQADVQIASGVYVIVTNYERLHLFDPSRYVGVVLDESGCIKHFATRTLTTLAEQFARTPFKLAATATPSPNDYTELGTHAEFLGVCKRTEMLAEFFVHDGGDTSEWRLKGHARAHFWRFVAKWGALIRKPSDLGFDDAGYVLPGLIVKHHVIPADKDETKAAGLLFAEEAQTLRERRTARRASLSSRVARAVEHVNADDEKWIVWTDLNDESAAATKGIRGAVEVKGANSIDEKESRLLDFAAGKTRTLVTKSSIAGWGLNFQVCARMAFVGLTDSYEAYYQALRRCYRFGQKRVVEAHIFTSELEGAVVANLQRKEADATRMAEELSAETRAVVREEVTGQKRVVNEYAPARRLEVPSWLRAS